MGNGYDDGPLQVQFISGTAKDGRSLSLARSHAMKAVRSRQRRQKQREAARRGHAVSSPRSERSAHPTICTFEQATLDPFRLEAVLPAALAGQYAHVVDEIKAHALTFCPMKAVVFPVAAQKPALMISLLYMSYAHLWSMRGFGDANLSLRLKSAAISEINRNMAQPGTATCTNLIAAVSYLAMGTWGFNNPLEETSTHLNGVKAMVAQRGMPSLGVYKFGQTVRKLLALQHIVMAGITAQPVNPVFNLDLGDETESAKNKEFTNSYIPSSWDEVRKYLPPETRAKENLWRIVDAIDGIVGLVTAEEQGALSAADCLRQLTDLDEQLSSSKVTVLGGGSSITNWELEAFRLAAKVVIESLIERKPLKANHSSRSADLVNCIRKTDLNHRELDTRLMFLFVLLVGSATSASMQDQRYLRCMLSQTMSELAILENGFSSGMWIARRFVSLQETISRRSS